MPNQFRRSNTSARKLTGVQVIDIRERFAKGETQGSLARAFGVSVGQIGRITRGESWQAYGGQGPRDSEVGDEALRAGMRLPTNEELLEEAKASEQRLLEELRSAPQPPRLSEEVTNRVAGYGARGLEKLAQTLEELPVSASDATGLLNELMNEEKQNDR